MPKVINPHALLEPIVRPRRFRIRRLVNRRIANQIIQRPRALERLEVEHKVLNRLQISKLELHDNVGVLWYAHFLSDLLALLDVADCHDDKMSASFGEGDGAVEAEAGGGAGNDGEFSGANFDAAEDLGGFLVCGEVDLCGKFCLG